MNKLWVSSVYCISEGRRIVVWSWYTLGNWSFRGV